jgi:hypothetical protein
MGFLNISGSFLTKHDKVSVRLLLLSCLFVFAYLAVSSLLLDSATDDEPVHIAAGFFKLKYGYFNIYNEQPPLVDSLCALPLLVGNFNFPPLWEKLANQWAVGHVLLHYTGHDPQRILLLARLPIVVLFVLLCILVYVWVYTITRNRFFALLGFVLTGFCPNLIAHGRLATSDMGLTFVVTLSAFLFLRFLYNPSKTNAILTGLDVGCAFLSKVSGLILLLYCPLVLVFFFVYEGTLSRRSAFLYLIRGMTIITVSLLCIEVLYLLEMRHSYLQYAYPQFSDSIWGRLIIPFKEYSKSVSAVFRWVADPYNKPQFLLGAFSFTGWWYYYIVAFILKTPLPVILLFLFSLFAFMAVSPRYWKSRKEGERQYYFHVLSLCFLIFFFFAISSLSKVNIGLRYILPVYPCLYIFVTLVLFHVVTAIKRTRPLFLSLLTLLVLWHIASSLMIYPSYLSYFNELSGNDRNADRYLIDSNLDWGQDLKRLALWVNANGVPSIHVAYFGGGEPFYYLGYKAIPLTQSLPDHKLPGYYAISRHIYRSSSSFKGRAGTDLEAYFADAKYITTIGKSIYVFKVE